MAMAVPDRSDARQPARADRRTPPRRSVGGEQPSTLRLAHRFRDYRTAGPRRKGTGGDPSRQKAGGRVALDDFGTGQSGFLDLIGLEVDFIKLDHSHIEPLNRNPLTERLVRAFAVFAAVLHVDLVAEGGETPEQAAFLRAVGIEKGQGFLWSRALPAEELIARHQSEHAWDDVPQIVSATPP